MYEAICNVCRYFAQFSYPPTIHEIHTFLPRKISRTLLKQQLHALGAANKINRKKVNGEVRYALRKHADIFQGAASKLKQGTSLFTCAEAYLPVLRFIPSVCYLGISGSLSMKYISGESDIDIFVVAAPQTIWQTRFALLVYKHLLMMFSPQIGKKLCFNLFFAEDGFKISQKKQTEYIGHEILQLKTMINNHRTYEKFIQENRWIVKFFPNVHINTHKENGLNIMMRQSKSNLVIEQTAKQIQKWWLNHKKMNVDDFGAQVWFIQDDFEKKIRMRTRPPKSRV